MSSLISSYFIDPVVRQARRFSSSKPSPQPPVGAVSHANRCLDSDASHATATATATASAGSCGITQHQDNIDATAITESCSLAHTRPASSSAPPCDVRPADCLTSLLVDDNSAVPTTVASPGRTQTQPPIFPEDDSDIACDTAVDDSHATIYLDPVAPAPGVEISRPIQSETPLASSSPSTSTGTPTNPTMARTRRTSSGREIARAPREKSPSASLPADDGMRLLRQKIHSIRELQAPQDEKARQMHNLMTEEWQAAQNVLRPQSPASMISHEPAFVTSSPLSSIATPASPGSTVSLPVATLDQVNPFNIQPEDLQPSYRPLVDPENAQDEVCDYASSPTELPEPVLGCKHYKRNVKIQCHDCREWHSCRHCHDAAVTTHHLNRRATENMLCMLCWTPQAAAQSCKECGERAAWYYCDICKLWDDDASKSIYHCPDCGICRRGEGLGKDFVHCKKCNVCISISHYGTHTCIENATDSNCPLCLDYMFTSPLEIVAMPCGHYLHHHCYTSLMLSSYQCPICKRSAVNMETQWRKLEEEIRHQPMPREWGDVRVEVKCNDCAANSVAPFHWLGVKCGRCDGFNTVQVRLLAGEDVQRDVQDFAEQRRERRAEERALGRDRDVPRISQRAVTVRPYFLVDEEQAQDAQPGRFRSGDTFGNSFTLPEMPRLPEFSVAGRLPQLPELSGRLPGLPTMPTMPTMPAMPGFNLPFDMLGRVGRSLSPIRHYFDDQIVEGVPRQFRERSGVRTSVEDDEEWRQAERWFLESSDEDDDDDYEDDSEEDEDEDEDLEEDSDEDLDIQEEEDEDEADERHGKERLDLSLTGHR